MSHNQNEKPSAPSRFSFQKVHRSQQSASVVDPGCRRCQYCWIRQQLSLANAGATTLSQRTPGGEREKEGGTPCP